MANIIKCEPLHEDGSSEDPNNAAENPHDVAEHPHVAVENPDRNVDLGPEILEPGPAGEVGQDNANEDAASGEQRIYNIRS